jgi:hypothetical protein
MTRWPVIAALVLATLPARAQDVPAQNVIVRTSRQPDGPVMLGQPVHLFVDVLFPDGMQHPPRVDLPRVAGGQVFQFESQATTIADRIGDTPITGQRFEFDLYARRAGNLAVSAAHVTLLDQEGDPIGTRMGTPLIVPAVVPPGLDPSGPIVASNDVTMRERWEPPDAAAAFRVGDALVRVITRQVEDVPGLALAALAFPAPDGVRAYVDPPVIEDSVDRGAVIGRRTDRVAYVFERPGEYTLPGLAQPWWDLDTRTAHVLSRPARHVQVAGAAAPDTSLHRGWLAAGGMVLALFAALLWLIASIRRRHATGTDTERAAFRALIRACSRIDAVSVYRAWQHWNALRASRTMLSDLSAAVAALECQVFSRAGEWDAAAARRFASAARATREPDVSWKHGVHRVRPDALPPLNSLP